VYKERLDIMETLTNKNKNLLVYVNKKERKSSQASQSFSRTIEDEKIESEGNLPTNNSQEKFQEYPNYPEYPSKRITKLSSKDPMEKTAEKIKGILLKVPNLERRIKSYTVFSDMKPLSYNALPSPSSTSNTKFFDPKGKISHAKVNSQEITKDSSKINLDTNGSLTSLTPKQDQKEKRRKSKISLKLDSEEHRSSPSLFTPLSTNRKGSRPLTIETYNGLPALGSSSLSPRLMSGNLDQILDQNYLLNNYRSSMKLPLTPNGDNGTKGRIGNLITNGNAFAPRRRSLFGANSNTQYKTSTEIEFTRQPSIILYAPQTPSSSRFTDIKTARVDDNLTPRLLIKTLSTPSKLGKIQTVMTNSNVIPREKVKMVINPLKKQNFVNEAKKIEAYMKFKMTGKIKF